MKQKVKVITLSTNVAPRDKRVVWNIVKLNTDTSTYDPSDKEVILLKAEGLYEFNIKILGVSQKNCYPCLSFNGTPEIWMYGSSGKGYQDCMLNGYVTRCRENTLVRVELKNGSPEDQGIYVNTGDGRGVYHYMTIKKLD